MAVATQPAKNEHPPRMCAFCLDAWDGPTTRLSLGFDVSVWLCETHASEEFRTRRGGHDFEAGLERLWLATGHLKRQHRRALKAHLERAWRLLVARRRRH